MNMFLNFM